MLSHRVRPIYHLRTHWSTTSGIPWVEIVTSSGHHPVFQFKRTLPFKCKHSSYGWDVPCDGAAAFHLLPEHLFMSKPLNPLWLKPLCAEIKAVNQKVLSPGKNTMETIICTIYRNICLLNPEFPRNNEKSIDKASTKTKYGFNGIRRFHKGNGQ